MQTRDGVRRLANTFLYGLFSLQVEFSDTKMRMKLMDISLELLEVLVSQVEPSSWKCLRLLNKACSAQVTPMLVRNIEVWIQA